MPRTNDAETPKPEPDPFAPRRPASPRLPRALAHVHPPDAAALPDTTWRGIRAEGWSVPGAAVSTLEFDSCALDGLDLSGVSGTGIRVCSRLSRREYGRGGLDSVRPRKTALARDSQTTGALLAKTRVPSSLRSRAMTSASNHSRPAARS